jgi:hypothetical protein
MHVEFSLGSQTQTYSLGIPSLRVVPKSKTPQGNLCIYSKDWLKFKRLVKRGYPCPNTFTIAFVLKACSNILDFGNLYQSMEIHEDLT